MRFIFMQRADGCFAQLCTKTDGEAVWRAVDGTESPFSEAFGGVAGIYEASGFTPMTGQDSVFATNPYSLNGAVRIRPKEWFAVVAEHSHTPAKG